MSNDNVVTLRAEGDKPFSLDDLQTRVEQIYKAQAYFIRHHKQFINDAMNEQDQIIARDFLEAQGLLQELVAIVAKHKSDQQEIAPLVGDTKIMTDQLGTEKPEFYVSGVQLIERGKMVGTSLYKSVVRARQIRDILNGKFSELKVDHNARIINYPVF